MEKYQSVERANNKEIRQIIIKNLIDKFINLNI